MKRIALIAPFGEYKSFSISLEDDDTAQLTPLIYLKKSSFITDEEYVKLVKAFQIAIAPNYVPTIIEEKK
jgi:hypothetical protein